MTTTSESQRPADREIEEPQRHRGRSRLVFVLTLLASLFLQSAWILVVPPFVGMDENQHATKAAAVAHGDWNPRHQLVGSYGGVVEAPRGLVEAAEPVCEFRGTTDRFNCRPIADDGQGMVTITSMAAAYSPTFYAVVGTAARPFSGLASFYAMRATAALLCALMIGLAATVTTRWARTLAPLVALQIAAVPVLWYSVSILAPNGLEMCCGLVLWSAILGIIRKQGVPDRLTTVSGTLAACLLPVVRSTGSMWLGLILVAALIMTPRSTVRVIVQSRWAKWSALTILLSVGGAVAWLAGSLPSLETVPAPHPGSAIAATISGIPLWALGSFALYPGPTEPAPLVVYLIGLVLWGAFLRGALGNARRGVRLSMLFVVVVTAIIPVGVTLRGYQTLGLLWQGRYALPLLVGVALTLGYALDEKGARMGTLWIVSSVVATFSANLLSMIAIVHNYQPYRGLFPSWPSPNPTVLIALVSAGAILTLIAFRGDSRGHPRSWTGEIGPTSPRQS